MIFKNLKKSTLSSQCPRLLNFYTNLPYAFPASIRTYILSYLSLSVSTSWLPFPCFTSLVSLPKDYCVPLCLSLPGEMAQFCISGTDLEVLPQFLAHFDDMLSAHPQKIQGLNKTNKKGPFNKGSTSHNRFSSTSTFCTQAL